jgi:cation diffusion facilitator family transporter
MGSAVNPDLRDRKGMLTVTVGLVANVLLAASKTLFGIVGRSSALLSDGINSTSDVAYYLVVAVFMRLARKPADEAHPYGHSQLESIAALVVGSFVVTTGVAVFWNAVNDVYELISGQRQSGGAEQIALWMALLTVLAKVLLTVYTRRAASHTGNAAVLALAYDHRNDIFSAAGAGLGIFLGRMGYPWVDPLAGAVVALLILRTGVGILHQSSIELMDAVPSRTLREQVERLVNGVPGVKELEEVHAHRFGPYLVINVIIGIDGQLSVAEGDEIASSVERRIYDSVDLARRVYVHYHPQGSIQPEPVADHGGLAHPLPGQTRIAGRVTTRS